MPTYAYACTECGHRFETVQSFSDDALTECPECEGRLRKVFSNVGIVFKGSGFYRTDSRSDAKADGSKSDASKSTEKSETSPEKPAKGGDKTSSTGSTTGADTKSSGSSSSPSGSSKAGTGSGSAA